MVFFQIEPGCDSLSAIIIFHATPLCNRPFNSPQDLIYSPWGRHEPILKLLSAKITLKEALTLPIELNTQTDAHIFTEFTFLSWTFLPSKNETAQQSFTI